MKAFEGLFQLREWESGNLPLCKSSIGQAVFRHIAKAQLLGHTPSVKELVNDLPEYSRAGIGLQLRKLEKEGCAKADLVKLQEMISAENSDLFDVLEYISYARKPITRENRVKAAESNIYTLLNNNQREFIGFVLRNYVQDGVDELDIAKLSTVIKSKYGGIPEAEKALGSIDDISKVFIEFQKQLYQQQVA